MKMQQQLNYKTHKTIHNLFQLKNKRKPDDSQKKLLFFKNIILMINCIQILNWLKKNTLISINMSLHCATSRLHSSASYGAGISRL